MKELQALVYGVVFLSAVLLSAKVNGGRVGCYFNKWALYRNDVGQFAIENIPGDLCTHAMYSFAGINTNTWQIKINDEGIDEPAYSSFTALKQRFPNLKTLIAIGGGGERGFSSLVSTQARRETFINSVIDFVNKYGFDGIDLDWEYPGSADTGGVPEDKNNFVYLVQELKAAFNSVGKGWEITMAVSLVESYVRGGYDVPVLCNLADAIHAMAYDMRGTWTGYADVQSPMYSRPIDQGSYKTLNLNDSLQMWVDMGCAPNKLVVGVPTYGRTYTLAGSDNKPGAAITGEGNPGPYTSSSGVLAYYEICLNQWPRQWDDTAKCPYAFQGNQWVGYDDPESVQIKMDFIKQRGYGGAMTWTVDMDDFRGVCGSKYPLITILSNNMKSDNPPSSDTTTTPVTTTTPSSGTPTCTSDGFVADQQCDKYYECVNGVAYEFFCQGGTVWNPDLSSCDWPWNSPRPECRQQ
ncbi:endochitinase-like [Periplaneta americana]|uniref:endochitinase-like n=1 Tax=Periplaneta americana TaxID=6978 RepID=UPI0037E7CF9C